MNDDKTKRLSVYLPEQVKNDLEQMAAETGLSMTQLIVMATHGLIANFKSVGGAIFADLVSLRQKNTGFFAETVKKLNSENATMQDYYGARALEYEEVYRREDPNYQQELSFISIILKSLVKDRRVLEIACGTGYWTRIAAEVAQHIVGIDIRPEVIDIAKEKNASTDKVEFRVGDAYNLGLLDGRFDFGLANFWFSHIPKNKIDDFINGFHKKLQPGAKVFMADNVWVKGRGGDKLRELSDGSRHEVLKNYYSYDDLHEIFQPVAKGLNIFCGKSFWYVSYTAKLLN